jgi:ribosomal protein S27AE
MAGENSITVVCSCGKKLKAPATSAGKKARCPACGATVLLNPLAAASPRSPAAPRPAAPSRVTAPVELEDDGLDAMYELAAQENSAAPLADSARCPQCQSVMADGALLCTNCGYNVRTGKAMAGAPIPKPAKPLSYAAAAATKKPVDHMAPQGIFIAGLAMSAAFALAASLVWIAVAWLSGLAIGYIGILIGIAGGLGMRIGHKGFSTAGGYAAAAITLLAILAAKLAVLELVMAQKHPNASIFAADPAKLGYYFFSPIGLIIIVIAMAAAFRTANGGVKG